jgi:hypothetical protein
VKVPVGGGRVAGAFPYGSANCAGRDDSRMVCIWGYVSKMGWERDIPSWHPCRELPDISQPH